MRDEEVVRRFQNLVWNGKAEGFKCLEEHGIMHAFQDLNGGGVVFECLVCNNKLIPGLALLERIHLTVFEHIKHHSHDCRECIASWE